MIHGLLVPALLASLLSAAATPPAPKPERPRTPRNRMLDLSADVLQPSESQMGINWARYARGIVPGLQLSTDLAPLATGFVNLTAKGQLVRREELRVSLEAGAYYNALFALMAASAGNSGTLMALPAAAHATVPLVGTYELDAALKFQWIRVATEVSDADSGAAGQSAGLDAKRLATELTLARYDARGAFFVQGRFPLLTNYGLSQTTGSELPGLGGNLTLNDLGGWGVLVGRDLTFKKRAHLRAAIGYRSRQGFLFFDSIRGVMWQLDVYWR